MPDAQTMSRVLIVEDEESVRSAIEAGLEVIGGYEVMSAVDASEGLNHLKNSQFDVLLLDLVMPVMDGMEFLREIRSDAAVSRPGKVILMTALENPVPEDNLGELGIDRVLSKPFRLTELADAVGGESPY